MTTEQRNTKIRLLQICLTLFYGQLFSNAIYDNFIRGIPDLVRVPTAYYNIFRVSLGAVIFVVAAFSVAAIWIKKHKALIFASGVALSLIFISTLVVSIIDLIQRKERKYVKDEEFLILCVELAVESLFRVIAIVLTFLFVKISSDPYQSVETKEDKA